MRANDAKGDRMYAPPWKSGPQARVRIKIKSGLQPHAASKPCRLCVLRVLCGEKRLSRLLQRTTHPQIPRHKRPLIRRLLDDLRDRLPSAVSRTPIAIQTIRSPSTFITHLKN